MKKYIVKGFQALMIVPVLALGASLVLPSQSALAVDCQEGDVSLRNGVDCAKGTDQNEKLFGNGGMFSTITNVLLFVIGAISVIMLIIGGIRYTVSGGDSNAITSAKNTILYAIVGIVVAILAYAAVNFVVGSFKPDGA